MRRALPTFGDEPPLVVDRRRRPDKRQISARWLAGTLLTGIASTSLMGISLSAALEDHRAFSRPYHSAVPMTAASPSSKDSRVVATALPVARSRQIVELPTMVREGDREMITTRPFGFVNMLLAARYQGLQDYPDFDPLTIFAADKEAAEPTDADPSLAEFYSGRVEAEVSLRTAPFPFEPEAYEEEVRLDTAAAEALVRELLPRLSAAPIQVASLSRIDPFRFDPVSDAPEYEPGSAFRVVEENVSLAQADLASERVRFHEEILAVREPATIGELLEANGFETPGEAVDLLDRGLDQDKLEVGETLRVGVETLREERTVVRLSVYRDERHLASVAATEEGIFEPAEPPEMSGSVAEAFDQTGAEAPLRSDMPTVYDGLWQAALSYGLNERLCAQLVRMLASDVDLQSRLSPSDRLMVFYSIDEEDGGTSSAHGEASEILFVEIAVGDTRKRFYRFRPEGAESADYFDSEGRSARQFLIRKPVANGRFTSGFSSGRRHPVLGYNRPHWGVDWAAPRGSAILAAGDGTVVKAGWASGYGRQTVIRHANGYVTSYSHQSAISKGIKAGSAVRQGQVIGRVGSTGLSTGNHLHYEIEVNGKRVDPMRIKLPSGAVLEGDNLAEFEAERKRIDELLEERIGSPVIASR